jgi:sensor domain CHASE-containing protein
MSFLSNCWQVAAYGREVIAGRIITRRIASEPLILFRTAKGKLVAMEDRCPGAVAGRRVLSSYIEAEARAVAA